jgi:hypothetical protein
METREATETLSKDAEVIRRVEDCGYLVRDGFGDVEQLPWQGSACADIITTAPVGVACGFGIVVCTYTMSIEVNVSRREITV